ncbi:efflux RND transporter permease subunit [Bacteriovoracaceae bacterium]|nr:efflux RND transporter permease subunit [Bacteriovoracaceae bacterium]
MKLQSVFNNPKRIYFLIGIIICAGLLSLAKLPISLYPNSSQPEVSIWIPYNEMKPNAFLKEYGKTLEWQLQKLNKGERPLETIEARYHGNGARYDLKFGFGLNFEECKKDIETIINSFKTNYPKSMGDRIGVWQRNRNSGYIIVSMFNPKQSLEELYDEISPMIQQGLNKLEDTQDPWFYNPGEKELVITLKDSFLFNQPNLINLIRDRLSSFFKQDRVGDVNLYKKSIGFSTSFLLKEKKEDVLNKVKQISLRVNNKLFLLEQIADVELKRVENQHTTFKTEGVKSLIIYAAPKDGGNIKRLSDQIIQLIEDNKANFPEGFKYKTLVNPGTYIDRSIKHLISEVFLSATLAVLILFLFLGNPRSIMLSAIEIPLSMLVAFICMRFFDVNINLISLGGLALACGMNVDSSVVVVESIMRTLKGWRLANPGQNITRPILLELILKNVKELAVPLFLSMVTTLIVFVPLLFTNDLANAILGDLAKAVIFSHFFSFFIAIFIVPTLRLKFINNQNQKGAPLDKSYQKIESGYLKLLDKILTFRMPYKKAFIFTLPLAILTILYFSFGTSIKKELIGKPDSDILMVNVDSDKFIHSSQLEQKLESISKQVKDKFSSMVDYSFIRYQGNNWGAVAFKLFSQNDMKELKKKIEEMFKSETEARINVWQWNPATMPLPEIVEKRYQIKHKDYQTGIKASSELRYALRDSKLYNSINARPGTSRDEEAIFVPNENFQKLKGKMKDFDFRFLYNLFAVSKDGEKIEDVFIEHKFYPMRIKSNDGVFKELDTLMLTPIKVDGKLYSLQNFGNLKIVQKDKTLIRHDGMDFIKLDVDGLSEDFSKEEILKEEKAIEEKIKKIEDKFGATIITTSSNKQVEDNISQVTNSLILSFLLVLGLLYLMYQRFLDIFIISYSVVFSLCGVIVSLWLFESTLSLNSLLGMILLNGLAVNNAILLIDYKNRLINQDIEINSLVKLVSQKRLRAILITSMTTILGMLPIALGLGEGGKILQPLGVAICGGLLISTGFSLVFIPLMIQLTTQKRINSSTKKDDETKRDEFKSSFSLEKSGESNPDLNPIH